MIIHWRAKHRQLQISEQLLADLGYPHVLILELRGAGMILYQRGDVRATAKERKVNYPQRAMPRLGIGDPELIAQLRDGRYTARVIDGAIVALPE